MVAQIGAFAGVAYGVDHLPRYGGARGFAMPIFAAPAPGSLAARFGGVAGRLTPGSPAHVALFSADGPPLSRSDAQLFLDGEPATAWPEAPEQAALWAAALRGPGAD